MSGRVRFGVFEFDPSRRELRKHGLKIRVPGQSLEILAAVVDRPGEIVTRERIRGLLWPHGTVVEFEQSIRAAVKRLREAIGDPAVSPHFIERVPRQGYRFIATVEALPPSPASTPELCAGKALLHYHLVEKIGQGSMGEVWRAEDTKLGRIVALKFIPEHLAEDAAALEAFRAEARHAAALNDPNICAIHGLEEHDGRWFLVIEYIDGLPLSAVLAGEPLPVVRILDIGAQAATALAAAHKAGIIHRDIKPANLMLTPDGRVKLTDFGVAKATHRGEVELSGHRRQSPTGTLEYMSPEQARGEPVDAGSDLFSLGAVLYEMATGKTPFHGDTPAAVLDAVLHQIPAPPRGLNRRLPRELERVILKALEKDPGARWQSAAGMAEALDRIGSSAAKVRRRLWLAAAASTAVAAAALAGWLSMRSGTVLAERDPILVAEFENTTGDHVFDGALRQALLSQIGQSRRYSIVAEERIRSALSLSGRPPGERFTRGVARDVCQRVGGKAVLAGSVGKLGSRYFIGLDAINCVEGDTLVSAYAEADSRERVLDALSSASAQMRGKLGESLASVRKFSLPAEATTRSLEALQAYSLALAEKARGNDTRHLLQHAIELDPEFASAWFTLALVYFNRGEESRAEDAFTRAYGLRGRTSERERLLIETSYHTLVSGNLPQAIAAGTLVGQLYPQQAVARRAPFLAYCWTGEFDRALQIARREMDLAPDDGTSYFNLAVLDLTDGRSAEARAVLDQARARGVSTELFPFARYVAAALDADFETLDSEAASAHSRVTDVRLLTLQVQTAGYFGQLARASDFARTVERMAESKDITAVVQATVAVAEAAFGREQSARNRAHAALASASGRRIGVNAALALALANEPSAAEAALQELLQKYPHDTLLHSIWEPTIEGAAALSRGNPKRALAEIQASLYNVRRGWPRYLRGAALMKLGRPAEAADEFRAVLQWKSHLFTGAVDYGGAPAYPASQLGLARAFALEGQVEESRKVYGQFLANWSRADADVPVLVEAKREYAALRTTLWDRSKITYP